MGSFQGWPFADAALRCDRITHVISRTRPSHFSACNIEKLEMGLGTRLAAKAKKIALESSQYELLDGVLFHTTPGQTGMLCVVVPNNLRTDVLAEAHSGKFSGHFAEQRIYNLLRCQYW